MNAEPVSAEGDCATCDAAILDYWSHEARYHFLIPECGHVIQTECLTEQAEQ